MDKSVFQQANSFLDSVYREQTHFDERPRITLTFAQSLDGKIAKKDQQVLISGKESLAMTHRLRTMHDGIMVGIGTALIDNPQLNVRYVEELEPSSPQPIVLDPFLRLPLDCKLIKNYQHQMGKQPWLVVSEKGCQMHLEKKEQLEKAGVKLLVISTDEDRIPLKDVYDILKQHGIHSLMIEGGSRIIQSCIHGEWDQLIITIGPMFLGSDGIPAITDNLVPYLNNVQYQTMGRDIVMAATK
ncbi:dihydrofolate reductase-like domain-containing protein [Choanephora cucurbitarum]|nr:dihydrofolate reductase-like domain-containing protein [Choanephora cucurbitarum]